MLQKKRELVKAIIFYVCIFGLGFAGGCGNVIRESYKAIGNITVAGLEDISKGSNDMAIILKGDPNDN